MMRYIITALLLLAAPAMAQDSPLLSVPGMTQAIATYARQAKAVGIVDFEGKLSAGGFLPIRTLHGASNPEVKYFAAGIGGVIKQGEHLSPRAMGLFDLSAITRRLESGSPWWTAHIHKLELPDFWIGPNVLLPMPGDKETWRDFGNINTWTRYLGISVAMGW